MPEITETTGRDLVTEVEELLAKATPGPWRADPTSIGYTIKADDMAGPKNGIGLPAFSIQLAKVWETDPNGEGPLLFHANANLIAAAPELLRRLVEEVKRLRGLSTDAMIQKIQVMQEKHPGQRIEVSVEPDGYCYVTRSDGNGNIQPIAEGATMGDVFED